jgi:hypothetical protein
MEPRGRGLAGAVRVDVRGLAVPEHPAGWRGGGVVSAVLDWDRIAVRPLGEEVARTAQVQFGELGYFDLERVAAFAAGYRSVRTLSRADLADAVERLWWKRMSDYWVFEFHYGRDDHGPDALMEPGKALLAWWTGHRRECRTRSQPGPEAGCDRPARQAARTAGLPARR